MTPRLVCVSGGIGSGKTETSSKLAAHLGWERASFGDYVRSVAAQRGLPEDRSALQQLGEQLIGADLRAFCLAALEHGGWSAGRGLVVDGVRHVEALEMIRRLAAPLEVFFIYLSTPEDVRLGRLKSRAGHDAQQLTELEKHSTEIQVKSLHEVADIVLDGTLTVEMLVAKAAEYLSALPELAPNSR